MNFIANLIKKPVKPAEPKPVVNSASPSLSGSKVKKPIEPQPDINNAVQELSQGLTSIKDIIAPPSLEVDFSHIKIDQTYYRTLFVAGYPRFVNANWLAPLINFDRSLNISMYIYPVEAKEVLDDLKRKIGEMEAEIQTDLQQGKIINIDTEVKLEDARQLQKQLAKGAERFFQFGLYITVISKNEKILNKITQQVQSALGSVMIISKVASLQMEDAFKTTLPTCSDKLMITRNMDTTSLATTFPFTSSELSANEGILYGINEHNESLIIFDRFTLENANSLILAKSGSGKSLNYHEPIIIKDKNGVISQQKIGQLVENLIKQHGCQPIDKEIEGVFNPQVKVYTFDKNLKNKWAKVTVAARKKAPKINYKFTTASGRKITTTADHNLVVLKNGSPTVLKSTKIKKGDFVPLPRHLNSPKKPQTVFNLLKIFAHNPQIYIKGVEKIINKHYFLLKKKVFDADYDKYLYQYRLGRLIPSPYFNKMLKKLSKNNQLDLKNIKISSCKFKNKAWLPIKFKIIPEFLRLLGYITSEGTIAPNHILISNTDPKIINDILFCFKQLKISCFKIKDCGVGCSTRVFVELIKALGASGKAGEKRVPGFIFNLSNNHVANYLKAYFEGDGTIEKQVTATSKSELLISDLMYLLLKYGIVARKRNNFKKATNSNHQGDYYYQIVISGQTNLKRFKNNIGFISFSKNKKLEGLLNKKENTNVDIIPGLESYFKQFYQLLYHSNEIGSPSSLSPLKRGVFSPSRKNLKKLIKQIEKRILTIESLWLKIDYLNQLPELSSFCQMASLNKNYNRLLWKKMGQSWRLMKKNKVVVGTTNVLKAYTAITGETYFYQDIKQVIYSSFKTLGESLQDFDFTLWTAVTQPNYHNTSYQRISKAIKHLNKIYWQKKLQLARLKQKLNQLKKLANSDLFWDPIIKIEKLKNKHKYVYDLMVDNQVFLAGFGGLFVHNSYLVKLEVLRSLMFDTEVIIIDPEGEYKVMCQAAGGEYIDFSFNSDSKINPFDFASRQEEGKNELGLKILSLHSLFKIIMGKLSATEEALLDQALVLTYKQKGITTDPTTQKKEPPLMEDLYKVLIGMEKKEALEMAARLEKFIKGSLRGIFDQYSTVDIKNPFTVFCIKELENELRPIAMFIILDFIWTKVKKELKRRILVVDEAWYLMKHQDSATFLYGIAKRARKYYLGLTTISQDVEDFLSSDHGKAIVTNSSIQILLKQSPAAIDTVGKVFYLSQGEKNLLLSAEVGRGLFFAGNNHVAIRVVSSEEEHKIITSKPQEILAQQEKDKSVNKKENNISSNQQTSTPQELTEIQKKV